MLEPEVSDQMARRANHWRTSDEATQRDRHERLAEMLRSSHLPWQIGSTLDYNFEAELIYRIHGGYRLAMCDCDRVDGYRSSREVADTNAAYLTLLYLREGREQITAEGREIQLNAGDMMLWDSTQKMRFCVPEQVQKISLLIPEETLISHLPRAHDYVGAIIRHDHSMGAILGSHMQALSAQIGKLSDAQLGAVMDSTLDLLAATLHSEHGIDRSVQHATLGRIKDYLVTRLGDATLNPASIARHFGISVRHLYSLFEKQGTSVVAWIRTQRMERARHELMQVALSGKSVTEIALDVGYTDLSHFSKSFKQAFGEAPRYFLKKYN
ncbi:MAG: helix-turn-helix domain-containing protein [Pseudomonadota bacterium]